MNRDTKGLLFVSAVGEAAMGLALIANPAIVARLLFGAELSSAGMAMSRVAGISLLAMGWACWPSVSASRSISALLIYSLLVTAYLGWLGFVGNLVGPLLWPAVALHVVLTGLLSRLLLNFVHCSVRPASGAVDP